MKLIWQSPRFFRRAGLILQVGHRRYRVLPWGFM